MKHTEVRSYAEPEAAARKLLELAAGVQVINDCHSACNIDPLSRGIGVQNLDADEGANLQAD
ncbi:hypothetical protein M2171_006518 [Bradyrhizobium japonicum USDA 38]|uniref:hypothetical protein n=1 Tax=Bradyrhizobium japonicum TaxID=375 RepID=UPI00048744CE|nr:hypothetical protein [Bradyrhizobium japonicum]MCS3897385.1 hypothetical protein [Bradyrhizobium japonicum USDA 38]MCS3949900.1 hypothetical protein [Bradyrhizobium japonicum]